MGLHAGARGRLLAATFLVAWAAGCGGGGGGSEALPAPPPPPAPQVVDWGDFPSAAVVIGKQNFDDGDFPADGTSDTELNFPDGSPAVSSDGRLFVAEAGAAQLKVFDNYTAGNGPAASFTFSVDGNGDPAGVSIHGEKLVVVEDHLVAIYDTVLTGPPEAGPDAFVGGGTPGCLADRLRDPRAAYITPRGQLVVADTLNHRVLIWHSVEGGGPLGDADIVLGQRTKTTCARNGSLETGESGPPSAATLNEPSSVWSDGDKLIVTDRANHRVLIWDEFPTADFEEADHVIGQPGPGDNLPNAGFEAPTASTLFQPTSVDVSETGQMAVADRNNQRVLIWNSIPAASGLPADQVIGQGDFTSPVTAPASIKTLNGPSGVRFDGRRLVVVDRGNNRVLVFRATN
jgi:hypothetical protein